MYTMELGPQGGELRNDLDIAIDFHLEMRTDCEDDIEITLTWPMGRDNIIDETTILKWATKEFDNDENLPLQQSKIYVTF